MFDSTDIFIMCCFFFVLGTIRAIVSIRVLNKTSEEYWFLMKFNVSEVGGDVDIIDVNETIDFFLIRLHLDSRLIECYVKGAMSSGILTFWGQNYPKLKLSSFVKPFIL